MKHFANNTLRLLLTAIGLSLAVVSAYLTAIFLYDYGSGSNYGYAYSISGVLLDLAKTFIPISALLLVRTGHKFIASLSMALCCVLMFTSYTISVSALSNSASVASANATEAKRHEEAIQSIRSQIATKENRIERLRKVNYHTDADEIQVEVDHLYTEYRSMLNTEVQASSESFDLNSAKILAALIEVSASVTLLVSSALGRPSANSSDTISVADHPDPLHDLDIDLPVAESEIEPPAVEPKSEAYPTSNPRLEIAKELLAGGQAKPSERALSEAMGLRRPDAAQLLNELESIGFLVRDGRVRVLAS